MDDYPDGQSSAPREVSLPAFLRNAPNEERINTKLPPPLPPSRPIGVSILSWLLMVGGVLSLGMTGIIVQILRSNNDAREAFSSMGLSPASLSIGLSFVCAFALASGIGFWLHKPWGWYLTSSYFLCDVLRNIHAIFLIPMIARSLPPEELAHTRHGTTYYIVLHAARAIVHMLFYVYCFKANVRSHFGISPTKWKLVAAELAICAAMLAAASLAAGGK